MQIFSQPHCLHFQDNSIYPLGQLDVQNISQRALIYSMHKRLYNRTFPLVRFLLRIIKSFFKIANFMSKNRTEELFSRSFAFYSWLIDFKNFILIILDFIFCCMFCSLQYRPCWPRTVLDPSSAMWALLASQRNEWMFNKRTVFWRQQQGLKFSRHQKFCEVLLFFCRFFHSVKPVQVKSSINSNLDPG